MLLWIRFKKIEFLQVAVFQMGLHFTVLKKIIFFLMITSYANIRTKQFFIR